jgi:ABC-2 type transport system ATP-binding protein
MIPPEQPAIRVTDLKKRFGPKQALDGVSFEIPRGSVAGFLGPNGAGKTTTLRILLGLSAPDAGSMELLGQPIPQFRCAALEKTGALVERPSFIEHFSGFDNLFWFGSLVQPVSTDRIQETLKRVGLEDSAHRPFGVYSTGMKQRLGVAAAILHRPSLLILDEPTNGMDPQGRAHMREIIKEIHAHEESTIFLSSHLLDEIQRLCDFVVIVDHGKTVKSGSVKDLLSQERETFEVRFAEDLFPAVLEALKDVPFVFSHSRSPRGLLLTMKPGFSAQLNQLLINKGIPVSALIPQEASLEDAFLSLTENETT